MEKKEFLEALKAVKESNKRKFSQTIDLIINLKGIDFKKDENKIDFFMTLPSGRGKKTKVCAFVDKELSKQAKETCDFVVTRDEFPKYSSNKKSVKSLLRECSFFIAQANIMTEVAKNFGKTLGAKGKMPNPKAGCVVPPEFPAMAGLVKRLQSTTRILTKNEPSIKVAVGTETMKEEEIVENILAIQSQLLHLLPQQENNIKDIYIKSTMGVPYKIGTGFVKKEIKVVEKKPQPKPEVKHEHKVEVKKEEHKEKKAEKPKKEVKEK
ncbi:MAG: 50S ribosomal protein L1 [Candidatus Nanoarchaeia archaeon]|nr:50S ribosomal protein L1 [Candidatus Nanoarchaeia archaeon]MDD5587969.1 50S ribosomal protein L1 [Candidatus Nanoarchaeia archaeon]